MHYTVPGLGRMTKRESRSGTGWLGNDTALNLDAGTADNYNGLDQFGRTTKQNVLDNAGSTTRTNIEYQANRDSSPQFAEPQSATVLGKSSAYTYDGLHRLSHGLDTSRRAPRDRSYTTAGPRPVRRVKARPTPAG